MSNHPSLSEIQTRFKEIVTTEGLKARTHENLFTVKDAGATPLETRLDIYRYAYFARIEKSLAEDFPKLRETLGAEGFSALVRQYLERYPSQYFGLAQVGRDLPGFLAEIHPETPELQQTAKTEWARCLCRWSESSRPTDFSKLLQLSEQEQQKQLLVLAPSTQIAPRGPKETAQVFFKVNGEVKTQELTPSMEQLLGEIQAGRTLGELTELIERSEELTNDAMTWISNWVSVGLIVSFFSTRFLSS